VAHVFSSLAGLLLRLSIFDGPRKYSRLFEDTLWWGTPEDFEEEENESSGSRNGEKNTGELLNKNAFDEEKV